LGWRNLWQNSTKYEAHHLKENRALEPNKILVD
jgi:hypothetical protein